MAAQPKSPGVVALSQRRTVVDLAGRLKRMTAAGATEEEREGQVRRVHVPLGTGARRARTPSTAKHQAFQVRTRRADPIRRCVRMDVALDRAGCRLIAGTFDPTQARVPSLAQMRWPWGRSA